MAIYDVNKLTKLNALKQLAEKIRDNYASLEALNELSEQIDGMEGRLGDKNVIESIKVNGVAQSVNNKEVNITVITDTEVDTKIKAAIAATGHASFETATKIPEASEAEENKLYLVKNVSSGYYDIYAKVGEEVVRLDDTTVDLSNYVEKEEGHGLYPDEDKEKLAGIASNANFYEHPESAAGAKESGLYKVATDGDGHVTGAEAVSKEDITKLGIPDKDTTYEVATTDTDGLMSSNDKEKLDGLEVASDEDVQAMLEEVFASV